MSGKRGRTISTAEFKRLWADMTISQEEIGRRLGITSSAVAFRAMRRNLPPRPNNRPFAKAIDDEKAKRLYLSGLSEHAVAGVLGCARSTVQSALNRVGVVRRSRNCKASISVAKVAVLMLAESARETQAAMWDSEMVDGSPRWKAA